MPYKTALNLNYDCGDFPANQQKALAEADWDGFPARRDEAKARGWIASYSGVPRDYGRER
jgi:carbon-monoxide dehydrogenase large subunit